MPIAPKTSQIATTLANAIAQATGLKPEQIDSINANDDTIAIRYSGPEADRSGGIGREAIQIWNTKTGQLVSDRTITEYPAREETPDREQAAKP